ncbi:MAG: hypothetical protein OHK0023_24480 [Anaerolineae bacterium]
MLKRIGGLLFVAALVLTGAGILASCGGMPPVQLVMIISPTPDPNVIMITVTPAPNPTTPVPTVTSEASAESPAAAPTLTSLPASATPNLIVTARTPLPPTFTPTLNVFPTETRAEIYIAQQNFQNGYMFWISTRRVLWVLINDPGKPNTGEWRVYQDTFAEGEPEFDPQLIPPSETLYQPRRGFGKLWRTTPGLRDLLGWATTPEFALNTAYVYQPGGVIDPNGKYVPGPGKHFVTTLGRETFALIESAEGFGRWERVG